MAEAAVNDDTLCHRVSNLERESMKSQHDEFTPIVPGSTEKTYHRNGQNAGFCVVTFDCVVRGSRYPMVAVVFKEPGKVAVFDRQKLGAGVIEFGLNSWCGDAFEKDLRAVIGEWD
jgi:hypothetical protein